MQLVTVAAADLRLKCGGEEEPDAEATLGGGTFVIPAIVGRSETGSGAHLTARDAAGHELERLPYRPGS